MKYICYVCWSFWKSKSPCPNYWFIEARKRAFKILTFLSHEGIICVVLSKMHKSLSAHLGDRLVFTHAQTPQCPNPEQGVRTPPAFQKAPRLPLVVSSPPVHVPTVLAFLSPESSRKGILILGSCCFTNTRHTKRTAISKMAPNLHSGPELRLRLRDFGPLPCHGMWGVLPEPMSHD